jgi:hypothetical protein
MWSEIHSASSCSGFNFGGHSTPNALFSSHPRVASVPRDAAGMATSEGLKLRPWQGALPYAPRPPDSVSPSGVRFTCCWRSGSFAKIFLTYRNLQDVLACQTSSSPGTNLPRTRWAVERRALPQPCRMIVGPRLHPLSPLFCTLTDFRRRGGKSVVEARILRYPASCRLGTGRLHRVVVVGLLHARGIASSAHHSARYSVTRIHF